MTSLLSDAPQRPAREFNPAALDQEVSGWFARSRVTRPSAYRLGRIMRSAQAAYDDAALQCVADRLCSDAPAARRFADDEGPAHVRLATDPGQDWKARFHAAAPIRRLKPDALAQRVSFATGVGLGRSPLAAVIAYAADNDPYCDLCLCQSLKQDQHHKAEQNPHCSRDI